MQSMQTVHRTPAFVAATDAAELTAEFLLIPAFERDDFGDVPWLVARAHGQIERARSRGELTGKLYDLVVVVLDGERPLRAALVGAGARESCTPDRLRRVAITGGLAARRGRFTSVSFVHRASAAGQDGGPATAAQVIAEGFTLANYDGASLKTAGEQPTWIDWVHVRLPAVEPATEQALERGAVLGECTNMARAMANEPGNHLTPRQFAERAAAIATSEGLEIEVLDETRIAALHMGLLLGVAQGSQEPPRLAVLKHEPKDAVPGITLALVGKGITFDTGGISIKPAENMDKMKDDMSGGAAVICAMAAIARLRAPVRCLALVPMTENMPGGRAIKPGDVLTSASGKTVEILNTDAEGRLVLGDAIWYARQLGATHLVDVATLTGACVVALGKTTSGVFGTPDSWVSAILRASEKAGDRSWPMPVFDDYKEQLKSDIADFTNTGGRAGGAITAALFIKEFTGDLPWAHIDIAGTAWAEESKPYQPKGATGVAVRTLAALALAAASWGKLEPRS
jgi:leucyl aminopeptidase